MKKFENIKLIISLIAIFFCAVLVWYLPVVFKGYNSSTIASHALVVAKNYSIYGKYMAESKLNVILAPELIPTEGNESYYGNKLGTIIYSYLFKFFHLGDIKKIIFVNCVILAIALLFFALTTYYLFGFKTFVFFSLIYIFLPANWLLPQMLIGYEFALLFLSLFFLLFSLGIKQGEKNKDLAKNKSWKKFFSVDKAMFALAGVFLILSCLCREALFLILPMFFIFLLFSRLRKIFCYIFIPVIIILSVAWLPSFISGKNIYLLFFTDQVSEELKSADFRSYAHLFPDPYTFHFDRKSYLKQFGDTENLDLLASLGRKKMLINVGFQSGDLIDRLKIGTPLFFRHIFRFFSLTEIGGPLVFLLLALGLLSLKRQKSFWFTFYIFWFLGSAVMLGYVNLANRNHLMDFGWAIATCSALGLILLAEALSAHSYENKHHGVIGFSFLLIVIYNLVLTGHVMWGQEYDNSSVPLVTAYAAQIKKMTIGQNEIIATSLMTNDAYNVNFSTQKSLIVFAPETIKRLIAQNKLKEAFAIYKVNYILGYGPDLSKEMADLTGVKIIADNKISILPEELEMNNKNWFLNLVK